jgi:ATP-dependent exoDNAse (exonuclease V) alpha subunit
MKNKLPTLSEFSDTIKKNLPFIPNEGQVNAISKIAEFILRSEDNCVFILKGYAGTGKTNLISALTNSLVNVKWKSVLLAPTGRAAKVISSYSKKDAFTIHKKIYKMGVEGDGPGFYLGDNAHKNTLFIVDEASMIGGNVEAGYQRRSLLEDLFEYVYSGENCKLLLCGDTAQLPPVGSEISPALDANFLQRSFHLNIEQVELKEVARQREESAVLYNATRLRIALAQENFELPKLICEGDLVNLSGEDFEDTIQSCLSNYGEENVLIITRSNKRAVQFNQGFRTRIKLMEEDLCTGDRLMVVKNNYFWLEKEKDQKTSFIANGDSIEIMKIMKREQLYNCNFTECMVRFIDDDSQETIRVKIITDCLYTDSPALTNEQQSALQQEVLMDIDESCTRFQKAQYLRQNEYYNALQVKFNYAVTCHKSQGGQWAVIFIDQGYLKEENMNREFLRWLYTALTRSTEKTFLLNFNQLLIS